MGEKSLRIRKVAVLGAGVMGAQIAAHLINAGIEVLLFDLPSPEGNRSAIALNAIAHLPQQTPPPLASAYYAERITALNYEQHLDALLTCDWVIEAIAEQIEWKVALYRQVAPYLAPHAILTTNTSGLSIHALAHGCPSEIRARFCGVHFFNPPRYMPLVELIATETMSPDLVDQLETFLVSTLGKGVIRAKDTPNFIANRIGVFSLLAVLHNAAKYGIRFDVVDDLTGVRLGRPRSATLRTLDVVGLDTFSHVLQTMHDTLSDDPWHAFFSAPRWLQHCLNEGVLGAKTQQGVYKKEGGNRYVLDPDQQTYVLADQQASDEVKALLNIASLPERFHALRTSSHPEAQFLWSSFRDLWHYIAYHFADIADNARDIDLAMRWGYGWQQGPFESWQAAGWQDIAAAIQSDIALKRALVQIDLPAWVAAHTGVHSAQGSYRAATAAWGARPDLAVYRRQLFPPRLFGETPHVHGKTCYENEGVRLWTMDDDIGIVSFKTKANCISNSVLQGLTEAIDLAERDSYRGLILWQPEGPFSVGADLLSMVPAFMAAEWESIAQMIARFQQVSMRLKYCAVPVVAAVRGYALGGGCELMMYCDRVVACLESYIGLVEAGVGLLPAGGGCTAFALRAAQEARADSVAALAPYYTMIATAKVASSAREAQELGYLRPSDLIILHPDELLYVAKTQVIALSESGYRPPYPAHRFAAAGRTAAATFRGQLLNMREGGYISQYDTFIAEHIADVMTGGDVDAGTMIDAAWMMQLERQAFMMLLRQEKTQQRITYTLKNRKPLRN